MNAGRIFAVASNTRKEAFRNRAFLALLILGMALIGTGWALSNLAVTSQKARVLLDFGYFAVGLLASIAGILMGVILLYKELDRKTIFTLLPKPVWRHEIVLGKFLGLLTLIIGLVVFLGGAWVLMLAMQDALVVAGVSVLPQLMKALVLVILEAMLMTSVALLFSAWTRPFLSGLFTIGYFVMGRTIFLLHEHLSGRKGALAEPGPLRDLAQGVTKIIPDLSAFNVSQEVVLGIHVPVDYVGASAIYALSFTAVFLVCAIVLFARRDFV
ncbi:MAG: ABC transporter permease subunit [Myxococcales bacterium]|nr:ABC transporter permease subunit [Myxococcales bacterium]